MCRMKNLLVVAGFVSAFVLLLGARVASADLITNASFELQPPVVTDSGLQAVPVDWNYIGLTANTPYVVNGTKVKDWFGALAPAGNQVVECGYGIAACELWQNTGENNPGFTLQNGYTYAVTWKGSAETTATETVRLGYAGNTSSLGTTFGYDSFATAKGTWSLHSVSAIYTGVSGRYLTIGLGAVGAAGSWGGGFDDLSLTITPVPEPSTLALLATALIGLLCYAWKKRR